MPAFAHCEHGANGSAGRPHDWVRAASGARRGAAGTNRCWPISPRSTAPTPSGARSTPAMPSRRAVQRWITVVTVRIVPAGGKAPYSPVSSFAVRRARRQCNDRDTHPCCRLNAERALGVGAAREIFHRAKVDPWASAQAHFKRAGESLQLSGTESTLTEEEGRLAHLFDEAEEAGLAACCEGRGAVPPGSFMQLLTPPAN